MKFVYSAAAIRSVIMSALFVASVLCSTLVSASVVQASKTSVGICQPNATYTLPAPVSLTSAQAGFTYVDDGFSYYTVDGSSADAIGAALTRCAPILPGATAGYLSYTSYNVSWQYSPSVQSDGLCSLSNVKVGLRINQLMPSLLNKATTSSALQAKWNTFAQAIVTHENGHKALDQAQARLLLQQLSSLHESCDTILSSAQNLTKASLQRFVAVNAEHDADTDHGATQGAVW